MESSREHSKRLGVLRADQLRAALDRFGLGRLLDAEPSSMPSRPGGGLFGQNVLLSTTRGELVLRGCPHGDARGRDVRQLQKERLGARSIHERTRVPARWPYRVETSPDLFGWSYAVMPRLPGVSFATPQARAALARADWERLARAMGEGLAALHALEFAEPAAFDPEREGWSRARSRTPSGSWPGCASTSPRVSLSEATTQEDVAWAESVIAGGMDALRRAFPPAFVHHDYTWGNTVFECGGDRWRVSGIFDLFEWYVGGLWKERRRTLRDWIEPALARLAGAAYSPDR